MTRTAIKQYLEHAADRAMLAGENPATEKQIGYLVYLANRYSCDELLNTMQQLGSRLTISEASAWINNIKEDNGID